MHSIKAIKLSEANSLIAKVSAYQDIKKTFLHYVGEKLKINKPIEYSHFFEKKVKPLLNSEEKDKIAYHNFYKWAKTIEKYAPDLLSEETLLEREVQKQKQQIMIRQDATQLMAEFLGSIREIAGQLDKMSPRELAKSGIKPMDIYKIIREEEDRARSLKLKERSEDRADAHFALLISMVKANQLSEEDIEFLENDTKKELLIFKKQNGVYQLSPSEFLGQAEAPAEDNSVEPSEGSAEGAA